MRRFLTLVLMLTIVFLPQSALAESYNIEINILRTLDMLLALPFKLINAFLGVPTEEPLPLDDEAIPVMI